MVTPTRRKRRSDTSQMSITGMKNNPYGFGESIDQPALSLNVSHYQKSIKRAVFNVFLSGHGGRRQIHISNTVKYGTCRYQPDHQLVRTDIY